MPTAGRDQRREQQAKNAQSWKEWLTTAMDQARVAQKDIVERSGGSIDKGSVSNWANGKNPASADAALTVARILNRDPMEALRAAGHDVLAEAVAEAVEREYRARIAEMDKQIEAKLAQYKGVGNGNGAPAKEATGGVI